MSSLFESISSKISFMEKSGIVGSIESIYKCIQEKNILSDIGESYVTKQSLIPILNVYILSSLTSENHMDSKESHYFYEVIGLLTDGESSLNTLVKRSQTAKITDLSYVERSAAVAFGRDIKRVPRLKIFDLVCGIYNFAKDELSSIVSSGSLFVQDGLFGALFGLLMLWKNLLAASVIQNETKLRVYHDELLKWIEESRSAYKFSNLASLESCLNAFGADIELSKGSAMSLIWEHSRAIYPASEKAWLNYENLSAVAEQFDEVALQQFPENLDTVNSLRSAFLSLFGECLETVQLDEFESMLENLKLQISKLEEISSAFLNTRSHLLQNQFKLLLNLIDSSSTGSGKIEATSELLSLALLSGSSTSSLLKLGQSDMFKPYPRVFDDLWDLKSNDYVSYTKSLFNDELSKSLNAVAVEMPQVPGGKINELLSDLKLFGSSLVAHSPAMLKDQLITFKQLLLNWIGYVCSLHQSSTKDEISQEWKDFLASLNDESYTEESLFSFSKYLEESSLDSLNDVLKHYFAPGLLVLKGEINKGSLGKAWVIIGCGFIQLYVPSSAYDPAITDHVMYDNFLDLQRLNEDIRKSWVAIRTTISGDDHLHAEKLLPEIDNDKIPDKPRIYRSGDSVDSLFEEWSSFVDSSVGADHIETLLNAAAQFSNRSSSQIDTFERNASQFVLRLRDSFSRYADVNDILVGYIYSIKLGFELMFSETEDNKASKISSLWPTDISNVTDFTVLSSICLELKTVLKSASIDTTDVEKVFV
ncbi:unnamed protein product [Ambrosiozyma monospora]|uniref:Unnamed protein product n=1 Tax=Ambrosiozyma monospora TaxID=43982 RepID=A0ACB5T384_AMBMO|nr:unnamed protein product [Ambrosiozyma monospora]